MRILFLFCLILTSSFAKSETANEVWQVISALKVADHIHWHRLLHFKKTMLGFYEGQIDSENFFISKNGKKNPTDELEAFVAGIFSAPSDQPEAEALQCRFPARYRFLKEIVGDKVPQWPDRPCPRFENWFKAVQGESVSLVFSSYYLNNPSSSFGHTLLRINKAASKKDGKRHELLDYGINFAANSNTSNPFVYTFKGLFGGFPGTFTMVPYYYKVREYNNSESRDLWEYELNLSQKAVDLLVAHIWEVGPTYVDYWYLTENCSYHMLTMLEAAEPTLDLTSPLKKYVIPTDTVHVAWQTPGLVRSFNFRPSIRTELFKRLEGLTPKEKSILSENVRSLILTDELLKMPDSRRRLVLDAAIDDMDYRYALPVQDQKTTQAQFKNLLLAKRGEIPEVTERLKIEPSYREWPHIGHGSRRWGLGLFERKNEGAGQLFNYRFAFHDILDPVLGYPEYAQITFFDLSFVHFQKSKKTELEKFMLFEVISLSPYSQFSRSVSWRLHVGAERLINEDCMGCQAGFLSGGAGYAWSFSEDPMLVGYLGIKAGAYYTHRWLLGAGPNLTFKARWSDQWVSLLEGWYRKDQNSTYDEFKEVSLATQWSPGIKWGLRVTGVDRWFEKSAIVEWMYYY